MDNNVTWLDRLRAQGQGRTIPNGFIAPSGEHVFILGGDGIDEIATLADGDYTEVKQVVDLTGWDFVSATMDTIGVVMGTGQHLAGFPGYPDGYEPLWHYNFDTGTTVIPPLHPNGFSLENRGDIAEAIENYSSRETRCKVVPVNSVSAYLAGINNPIFASTPTLPEYTFQIWKNFDAESHSSSPGVNPIIWRCVDGLSNGLEFSLAGAVGPGSHEWILQATHCAGGTTSVTFPGYLWDINPGWILLTITWNAASAPGQRLKLYIDDNPAPYYPSVAMATTPVTPALDSDFIIADPNLWGMFDEAWLLDFEMTPSQIAQVYEFSTGPREVIDYTWNMKILVNGETYGERIIKPAEQRRWTDFRVPVRHLIGDAEVSFRLELQRVQAELEFLP